MQHFVDYIVDGYRGWVQIPAKMQVIAVLNLEIITYVLDN